MTDVAPHQLASPAAAPPEARYIRRRPAIRELLAGLWAERALIVPLGIRVTIKGYTGTKLGRGWLVLRPGLSLFAMALLFGAVLDAPSEGTPYIVFLLVGMLGWSAFERGVFWTTRSFDVYRRIFRNFRFAPLVLPTAAFVPVAIELGVMTGFLAGALAVLGVMDGRLYLEVGPGLALAAVGLAMALVMAWSVGLVLSVLNARARDVRLSLKYFLMVGLYVTPVLYPVGALPGALRFLATINPMAAPVGLVRRGLLGRGEVEAAALGFSLAALAALLAFGLWTFSRLALRTPDLPVDDDEDEPL